MSTRVDSYPAERSGSDITGTALYRHEQQGIKSSAKVVAVSTQYDMTGSVPPCHSFIQDAEASQTKFHFTDGSIVSGNDLVKDILYPFPLQKVITHSDTKVVLFWK